MPLISRGSKKTSGNSSFSPTSLIVISVLVGVLVLQIWSSARMDEGYNPAILENSIALQSVAQPSDDPLAVPKGRAEPMPSVRVSKTKENLMRKQYGGKGDKLHLGGFTKLDLQGVSPAVWKFMVDYVGVKSIIDVGCGKGTSTAWFHFHGIDTLCVEGSHDAVEQNIHPEKKTKVVEHDFSRGPWWPEKTYDAIWCVEFLEHVGRNYHHNYLPVFRKAAFIFVTFSTWGGWHHVEVHDHSWWIDRFESFGFRYSERLSDKVRAIAKEERGTFAPNGERYNAQHVWTKMLVFINPQVAARPEYARMMTQPGCVEGRLQNRKCGKDPVESTIPPDFEALELTPEMDSQWEKLVFGKTSAEMLESVANGGSAVEANEKQE
eukprot:CAMPEP_0119567890 /NCGR_PEP_ID=MMETSP1352-20130426/37289_1 /TAXON_ID=265584 /ORGANISM="Stauroneis constricta, Strain CCMP1120" /LENGTH=377 /DNA_ID=CAMNT_0007617203 /DNA_START=93 /DNA_END=1226 /DNA_ORIENTATION=-